MALLWIDSFDGYTDFTGARDAYDSSTVGVSNFAIAAGKNGNGLRHTTTTSSNQPAAMTKNITVSGQTLLVGFAVRPGAIGQFSQIVNLSNSWQITLQTSGLVRVSNGSVTLNSDFALVANVWTYVEVKIVYAAGATGSVTIRMNGVGAGSLANVVTGATPSTIVTLQGQNFTSPVFTMDIDDLYVADGSGANNNDFLGPIKILAKLPDGPGAYSQWSRTGGTAAGNYTAVSETGSPDGDTSYVADNVVGHKDSYTYGDLADTSSAVKGVMLKSRLRKDDAVNRIVRPFARVGGVDFPLSNVTQATTYAYNVQTMETNPATGTAWTAAQVNGAEFGIEVVS